MARFLIPVATALFALPAASQIRYPGEPATNTEPLAGDVPVMVVPTPDVSVLRAEDEAREHRPYRYGATLEVAYASENHGRWDTTTNGDLVWRLEIASPGALTIGLTLSRYDLPAGGKLFLYDPQKNDVLGAYTEANEKPNGMLAVQPVRGDRIVLEYVHPGDAPLPELEVGEVIHDYRNIFAHLADATFSGGGCLVDINCPAGDNFQDVKRGVVWMFQGTGCTGFLVNNTAEDGKPYLMTAEHCGDITNSIYVFDYERSGCATGGSSQSKTISGATFLKASNPFDGRLYEMSQMPPSSYEPFYCGWTLDEIVEAPAVGVSHPAGNPKKIQRDNQPPQITSNRWNVSFEVGIIQGGSSGSPLFDPNKRVIGICSAGQSTCASNFALYGRFDRFYETRDLGVFLDPLGWGLSGIDGYDPYSTLLVSYNGTELNPEIFSGLTLPVLNSTFSMQVDTTTLPQAAVTAVLGYAAPDEGLVLAFGELLFDPTSSGLLSSTAPVAGGLSQHDVALPNDIAFSGRVGYLQAFAIGGGQVTGTNGLKAVLNF